MQESISNIVSGKLTKNRSIIVVGIVRDIEKTFLKDFKRLKKVFSNFDKIDWFLVESGSSDKTVQMLEEFTRNNSGFKFKHLEINLRLSRTENMAIARNAYLDHLHEESILGLYTYVVIADFNNLNKKVTVDSVRSCFTNSDWDVVTANQLGRYYDAWALRHPLWSPNDCWEQHAFFRKYTKFPETAITFSMKSRMLRIPKEADWIEVDSAFGGLAIYKSNLFKSEARYIGVTDAGNPICEHVPFHSTLRSNGARIFINPSFINTRNTDHSRRMSMLFTLFRICRYPRNLVFKLAEKA